MADERIKVLETSIQRFLSRGAKHNIQRLLLKTHAADVAAALDHLPAQDRLEVLLLEPESEKRASILSYLQKDHQTEVVQLLPKKELHQMVSLMERDDAADLLSGLPEEKTQEILSQLGQEASEEVADLMGYPEDTAGGIMSTDFVGLDLNTTVEQAVFAIQNLEESTVAFYVYVVNDNQQLLGVLSLKQLLLSKKAETLEKLMNTEVISVSVHTAQDEVASKVERYDFLAIPVVDDQNRLVGIVTVDDVIDVIRAEAEEEILAMGQTSAVEDESFWGHFSTRIPWLSLGFVSGLVCFFAFFFVGVPEGESIFWVLAAFMPLLLTVASTAGNQTSTVTINGIRSMRFKHGKLRYHYWQEIRLSSVFSLIFVLVILFVGYLLTSRGISSEVYLLSMAFTVQMFIASLLGVSIPLLFERLKMNPTTASLPLLTVLANLTAVMVLLMSVKFLQGA